MPTAHPDADGNLTGWLNQSAATTTLFPSVADQDDATFLTTHVFSKPRNAQRVMRIVIDDARNDDGPAVLSATPATTLVGRDSTRVLEYSYTVLRPNSVDFQMLRNDLSYCAPARSSMFTGRYCTNTGIQNTNVQPYYDYVRRGSIGKNTPGLGNGSPGMIFNSANTTQCCGPYEFDLALKLGVQLLADNPSDPVGLALLAQTYVKPSDQRITGTTIDGVDTVRTAWDAVVGTYNTAPISAVCTTHTGINSTTVTCGTSTFAFQGARVSGPGIPANTIVTSVTQNTNFHISNGATAAATVTLTIQPLIGRASSTDDLQATTGGLITWLRQAGVDRLMIFGKNQNGTGGLTSTGEWATPDAAGTIAYAKTNRFVPPGYTDFCCYHDDLQNHDDAPTIELFNATGNANPAYGDGAIGTNYEYKYAYPITAISWSGGVCTLTATNPHSGGLAAPDIDTLIYAERTDTGCVLTTGTTKIVNTNAKAEDRFRRVTTGNSDIPNFAYVADVVPGSYWILNTPVQNTATESVTVMGDEIAVDKVATATGFNIGAAYTATITSQTTSSVTLTFPMASDPTSGGTVLPDISQGAALFPFKMFSEQVMVRKVVYAMSTTNRGDGVLDFGDSWLIEWGSRMPHGSLNPPTGTGDDVQTCKRYELDDGSTGVMVGNAMDPAAFEYFNGVLGAISPAVDPNDPQIAPPINTAGGRRNWCQRQHMLASYDDAFRFLWDFMNAFFGTQFNNIVWIVSTDNGYQVGAQVLNGESSGLCWSNIGGKTLAYDESCRLFTWFKHPDFSPQIVQENMWIGDITLTLLDVFAANYRFAGLKNHHAHTKADGRSWIRLLTDPNDSGHGRLSFGMGVYQQSNISQGHYGIFVYNPATKLLLLRLNETPTTRQLYDMTPDPASPYSWSTDVQTINLLSTNPTVYNPIADAMSIAVDKLKVAGWDAINEVNTMRTIRV